MKPKRIKIISWLLTLTMLVSPLLTLTACGRSKPGHTQRTRAGEADSAEQGKSGKTAQASGQDKNKNKAEQSGQARPDGAGSKPALEMDTDGYAKVDMFASLQKQSKAARELAAGPVRLAIPGADLPAATLSVTTADVPPISEDAQMLAYDIKLDSFSEIDRYFDIRISYAGLDLAGQPAEGLVGAAYFNPESQSWEPVTFCLDEATNEAVITTNHLSVYSCFTIKNEGKRNAKIIYFDTKKYHEAKYHYDNYDIGMAYDMIKAAADNRGKVDPDMIGKYLDWQKIKSDRLSETLTIGSFVADHWREVEAPDFEQVSEYLGGCTLLLSACTLVHDLWKAWDDNDGLTIKEHQKLSLGAFNTVSSYFAGKLINSLGGVILLATSLLDDYIETIRLGIYENKKDAFRKGYEHFYAEKYVVTIEDWANFIKKARVHANNDPERLRQLIEYKVALYCRKAWILQDLYDEALSEVDLSKNLGGYTNTVYLTDTENIRQMQKEISEEYEKKVTAEIIPQAIAKLCEWDYLEQEEKLTQYLNKLVQELNKTVTFEFYDPLCTQNGQNSALAGAKLYLCDEDKKVLDEHWMCELDSQGAGTLTFTLAGWETAGAPEYLMVYGPEADPAADAPLLELPVIGWNSYKHKIALGGGIEYDKLFGHYYNGVMKCLSYELTDAMAAKLDEALGFSRGDIYRSKDNPNITASNAREFLEIFKTSGEMAPFRIVKKNDGQAAFQLMDLNLSSMMHKAYVQESYPFEYDQGSGILTFTGKDHLFGEIEYRLYCTEAEGDRGISVKGDIYYDSSNVLPGDTSEIVFVLEGTTSEICADGEPLFKPQP